MVMAGFGGVLVETQRDVQLAVAPVDHPVRPGPCCRRCGAPLILGGLRGSPPVHLGSVAETIAAVGNLMIACHPEIAELDLNPVLVGASDEHRRGLADPGRLNPIREPGSAAAWRAQDCSCLTGGVIPQIFVPRGGDPTSVSDVRSAYRGRKVVGRNDRTGAQWYRRDRLGPGQPRLRLLPRRRGPRPAPHRLPQRGPDRRGQVHLHRGLCGHGEAARGAAWRLRRAGAVRRPAGYSSARSRPTWPAASSPPATCSPSGPRT